MTTPDRGLSRFVREWRTNLRLRVGGWLILALLLLYISLLVSDQRQAMEDDYRQTAGRLGHLEALARQSEWPERTEAARALCVQLEGRMWRAEGRGMALAVLQNWIFGLLKTAAMNDSRVNVEPATDIAGVEQVWQVAVRIEGSFDAEKMTTLLDLIETHPQMTEIDGLEITTGTQGRFTLVLKAYFLAGGA